MRQKNNKTCFIYVLNYGKTWVFDQSEWKQGPIYIIKDNRFLLNIKEHSCHIIHKFNFWNKNSVPKTHYSNNQNPQEMC